MVRACAPPRANRALTPRNISRSATARDVHLWPLDQALCISANPASFVRSAVGAVYEGPDLHSARRPGCALADRMDTPTLGIMALSIAIGFTFTEVVFRRRRRGLRYAIAMLFSIGFVLGFTRYVVSPYVQSAPAVRFSAASQLLAAIERLEPAVRFGAPAGGGSASPATLRQRSMATVTRHAGKSSDEAIVGLAKTLVKNAQVLQRRDPALCVSYLFPASADSVDYSRYLDEVAMNEDLTAMAVALESAGSSTHVVPAIGDRELGIRTLRKRLSDRYTTADLDAFDQRTALARADRAFTCRIAIDLYREALELAPPQRAAVLRHLMAG